jgi:predicted transcriptional regulator
MAPDEYRTKCGLPPWCPMVAADYAAARYKLAKDCGSGRRGEAVPPKKRWRAKRH